jgi:hypothetical protein
MPLFRKKPEIIEAVKFTGQDIPNMAPSPIWGTEWAIRTERGTTNARMGDYIYLRDGRAVGSAAPSFFEHYYEPVENDSRVL